MAARGGPVPPARPPRGGAAWRRARGAAAAAFLGAALGAAACGDGAARAGSDAGRAEAGVGDAAPEAPAACVPAFGRTYVARRIALPLEGHGLAPIAVLANAGYEESIGEGNSIYLFDFLGWPDPAGTGVTPLELCMYQGIDADVPPDAENNLDGHGHFLVSAAEFDLECAPVHPWDEARLEGHHLDALAHWWRFIAPGIGTVEFREAVFRGSFDSDFATYTGTIRAAWTLCGLSRSLFPGSRDGTFLDLLANLDGGGELTAEVDFDGDGYERVIGDGRVVAGCVDGDGVEIPGADCPCDPRIADALSVVLEGELVRAEVVGVAAGS
jgi:hypothetical protein